MDRFGTIAGTGAGVCIAGINLGDGGPASAACVEPSSLAVGPDGSLYIGDQSSNVVRRIDTTGIITTFAGTGTRCSSQACLHDGGPAVGAGLNGPTEIETDRYGNVFILDFDDVRIVDPSGTIRLYAGKFGDNPGDCPSDGAVQTVRFSNGFVGGFTFGPDGSLYVGDGGATCSNGQRIRKLQPMIPVSTVAENGNVYTFDGFGRHVSTREQRTGGLLYAFGYDAVGRLMSITDGDGLVTTINHDSLGNPTSIVAPFGQTTLLSADANGYMQAITNPNAELVNLAFDGTGILQSMLDARGFMHSFSFSATGLLGMDEDAAGASQLISSVLDATGRTVMLTSGQGHTTSYGVHTLPTGDEETTTTNPSGSVSRIDRSLENESAVAFAPDGTTTSTTSIADPIYGMTSPQTTTVETTPAGLVRFTKTSRAVTLSNPSDPFSVSSDVTTTVTNPGNCALGSACAGLLTWTEAYSAATQQIVITSPLGRTTTTQIDARGRPVGYTTPGIFQVNLHYDTAGRVDQVAQGTRVSTTTFDPSTGWASAFTDSLGRVTNINARDGVGRVLSTTLPGARTVLSTFNSAGDVTSITPPGENTTTLSYTPVDLEASFTPPAVPGASGVVQSFYNLDRQQTQELRPEGSILFGYDAFGRLGSEAAPTLGISRGYNPADQLITLNSNDIGLAYTYDGSLLRTVTFSGEVAGVVERRYDNLWRVNQLLADSQSTAFSYDNDGLLIQSGPVAFGRDPQNGRVTGTTTSNVLDTWAFDGFGAVSHYDARDSAGSLLSLDYLRDNLGRITQITESLGAAAPVVTAYEYDAAGRLDAVTIGASAVTFGFDSNGNRTTVSGVNVATYDAQDRMLTYGANGYTYTTGGDLTSKTNAAGTTNYVYDFYGSLRQATLPGGLVLDYVVDADHRRVGKKQNGVLQQGWLYDGQLRPIAELDGANNIVSLFMYGERSNVPESMTKGGHTYRIVSDHLGSVRLVVDAITGTVAQSIAYDAWGNVTSDSAPGFQPFGFAGGLFDRDLSLVRFGARDYDPETGRWTCRDEVRFSGGDTDLYVYVGDDPTNGIDPTGEMTCKECLDQLTAENLSCDKKYATDEIRYGCKHAAYTQYMECAKGKKCTDNPKPPVPPPPPPPPPKPSPPAGCMAN